MMWRRRQVQRAQSIGVAQSGGQACAAGVRLVADGLPKVSWLWSQPVSGTADLIRSLRQAHGRRLANASLVLERSQYTLVSTEAPDVPREEWGDALRWQLKDQVDYPVDNAIVQALAVSQASQARVNHASIVLMAPHDQAMQLHLEASDEGHDWAAQEVPETALRNVCALGEVDGKAHALMAFGEHYSMLVITLGGELLMARTIEVGLTPATSVEAPAAMPEAPASFDELTLEGAPRAHAAPDMRGATLVRAGLEVLRTLDTFERLHSQVALSGVSVAVPPGCTGVLEALADQVYQPLKPFTLGDHLDVSALGEAGLVLSATPTFDQLCALGAALRAASVERGVQQISMLLPDAAGGPVTFGLDMGARLAAVTAVAAVVAGLGLSAWGLHQSRKADELEQQVAKMAGQAHSGAPRPPILIELEGLRETEAKQQAQKDTIGRLTNEASERYSEYLTALSRQAGGGLWITGMTVYPNGSDLELRGRMTDPSQLPQYLARLENEARFKGRRFAQLEMKSLGQDAAPELAGITEFALRAKVNESKPEAQGGTP